jgi:hypothetical protein
MSYPSDEIESYKKNLGNVKDVGSFPRKRFAERAIVILENRYGTKQWNEHKREDEWPIFKDKLDSFLAGSAWVQFYKFDNYLRTPDSSGGAEFNIFGGTAGDTGSWHDIMKEVYSRLHKHVVANLKKNKPLSEVEKSFVGGLLDAAAKGNNKEQIDIFLYPFTPDNSKPVDNFSQFPTYRLSNTDGGFSGHFLFHEMANDIIIAATLGGVDLTTLGTSYLSSASAGAISTIYTLKKAREEITNEIEIMLNIAGGADRDSTVKNILWVIGEGTNTVKISMDYSNLTDSFPASPLSKDGEQYYVIDDNWYDQSQDPPGINVKEVRADYSGTADNGNQNAAEAGADIRTIESPIRDIYRLNFQYPTEADAALLEKMKNYSKFSGGDITKYPFKYNKEPDNSWLEEVGSFLGGLISPEVQLGVGAGTVVKKRFDGTYALFFVRVLREQSKPNPKTVGEVFWNTFDPNFLRDIYSRVLYDQEIRRRITKFKELVKLSKQKKYKDDDSVFLGDIPEDIEAANKAAAESFEVPQLPKDPEIQAMGTKEDIEKRQKFFKQCALLLNMGQLSRGFDAEIKKRYKNTLPFDGRFHMLECSKNQDRLITNLISPSDGKVFFELPPRVMSYLRPKIRLYKVHNKTNSDGELQETEFIFPQHTDVDRIKDYSRPQPGTNGVSIPDSFFAAQFDKGEGCGLKEFSFEFNGTNPAESRNDIKATLKLYFQSFADFIRERVGANGKKYRFVDLVIQPVNDAKDGRVNNLNIVSDNHYDPSFYRIRAEVGYYYPENISEIFDDPDEDLKSAILRTNKSFFLCMVDHDFNIDIDGTVTVTISYRAYTESLLKSLRFDALTTRELLERQKESENELNEMLSSEKCTADQVREYKASVAGEQEELRKNSLRSIVTRLYDRNRIYIKTVDSDDAKEFRDFGAFSQCILKDPVGRPPKDSSAKQEDQLDTVSKDDPPTGVVKHILDSQVPFKEDNYNYNDIEDTTVQFFFFGDLLHTILDNMYTSDDKGKQTLVQTAENIKFVLGSFDFEPLVAGKPTVYGLNIAHIPISLDYFGKWFTDQVISQGETRKSFPILYFIRNLCNNLLQTSMLEGCVNRNIDKKLRFMTSQVCAYDSEGNDPLDSVAESNLKNGNTVIDVVDYRSGNSTAIFPLKGDSTSGELDSSKGNKINNFQNYLLVCTQGSTLTKDGVGNYSEDVDNGRYHINIGSNKGIVKTVKFSKTDMQYVREARFFRQGVNGLLQLSNVYKATIEMFGNTLFFPGMEVYVNPYGIGGTDLGSPTTGGTSRSIANILGLGGYHTIISVRTSLTPTNFTTTIEAQLYYTGDGEDRTLENGRGSGKKKNRKEEKSLEDITVKRATQTTENVNYCQGLIKKVQIPPPTLSQGTEPQAQMPAPPAPTQNPPSVQDPPKKKKTPKEKKKESTEKAEYGVIFDKLQGDGKTSYDLMIFLDKDGSGNLFDRTTQSPVLITYSSIKDMGSSPLSDGTEERIFFYKDINGKVIAKIDTVQDSNGKALKISVYSPPSKLLGSAEDLTGAEGFAATYDEYLDRSQDEDFGKLDDEELEENNPGESDNTEE